MPAHRIYLPMTDFDGPAEVGSTVLIGGEEARHAVRVKRLESGQEVELLDGQGRICSSRYVGAEKLGKKGGWSIELEVVAVSEVSPVSPAMTVCCTAPKGSRLEDMIDQLAQVGATGWRQLESERSLGQPRDGKSNEHKRERIERVAGEAAKQCGRAWAFELGAKIGLADALQGGDRVRVVMADASGQAYSVEGASGDVNDIRLLVGPEGGWTEAELQEATDSGASIASFGPHTLRLESAAVVAAAIVLDRHRRATSSVQLG